MPDITVDAKTRVAWSPAVANIAGPALAELNAGLLLHSTMTADGLSGFRPSTAGVPTSALDSDFDTETNGRVSYSDMLLRIKKQTGTDTIWTTLIKDATGFVVVRRWVAAATAWAAGQIVQVYPVICGETADVDPEPNTLARYEVPLKLTARPNLRAVVV